MKKTALIAWLITMLFVSAAAIANLLYLGFISTPETADYRITGLTYDVNKLNQDLKGCYNMLLKADERPVASKSAELP